ncbi:AraC family transcriptional regulator [Labedella endophytica]|nr:helix-turn-helix domain-containing protein [Labedella endophytica]
MQHYFLAPEPETDREPDTDPTTGATASSITSEAPLARSTVVGEDVDEARQTYQDAYDGQRFAVHRGTEPFSFRYASVGDDRVSLRTSTLTGHLSGEVPHLRDYVVSWFRSGGGELTRRNHPTSLKATTPFLLPSEQRFAFSFGPHHQNLVHFAPAFLEDIATEFHAGPAQAVSFDHDAMPSDDGIAQWRVAVSAATEDLVSPVASPILRLAAQRSLARSFLQLFPWFGIDVPPVLREPSLARTRLALEYLHHHAHEPVTPADAARAAGLHTRTLQHHLNRHLDTSPTAYLRDIRLDRTHTALAGLSTDETTVAAVAQQWGFGHLGRFSAAYRSRFGEHPRDTLRR